MFLTKVIIRKIAPDMIIRRQIKTEQNRYYQGTKGKWNKHDKSHLERYSLAIEATKDMKSNHLTTLDRTWSQFMGGKLFEGQISVILNTFKKTTVVSYIIVFFSSRIVGLSHKKQARTLY